LLRANQVRNRGQESEQADFTGEGSTHYTVLNLRRDANGGVVYKYSNSLGNHQGADKDKLPANLRVMLENQYGLNSIDHQQPFQSVKQGADLNCGYAALFNALILLEIDPPQQTLDEFVEVQKKMLRQINRSEVQIANQGLGR
jgi:hypothetical protein